MTQNAVGTKSLYIEPFFFKPDLSLTALSPFDQIKWKHVSVEITDDSGKVIFKQDKVEVPEFWSDLAAKVVVSKYFYGEQGTPQRENSVRQLIHRVCHTVTDWGLKGGYFDTENSQRFYNELVYLTLNQIAVFNSPVWFNVGLHHVYGAGQNSKGGYYYEGSAATGTIEQSNSQYEKPQCSACFIQHVADNMESIMQLAINEAMLFRFGSGTGTNLSSIRSKKEKLSGGGRPSGPMSFLRIYDEVANVVKSGGKTRRAAKMNIMNDWHGDIEEFIDAKQKEEKKAWALIEAGYEGNFNGEAYGTVSFQNENLSVRVSDEFMKIVTDPSHSGEWWTRAVTTGKPLEKKDAKALLTKMAEGTWLCGDPGIQFDDIINDWHTCATSGRIHATNPCSEYIFLDNTACNLASINLLKFREGDQNFDVGGFAKAVKIMILAQEILVDNSGYPTKAIALNSHIFRTLGLGFANLGALLMSYGLPYDSLDGRDMAAAITAIMTGEAYNMSAGIARVLGPFPGYHDASCVEYKDENKIGNKVHTLHVLEKHARAAGSLTFETQLTGAFVDAAKRAWASAMENANIYGVRNAQVTVLAPTGTIAFMMDCDTTGIEPDIALVKYKVLAGRGNLKIVNRTVEMALRYLGYNDDEISAIRQYISENDTIEGAPHLSAAHLPVFDCAFKAAKGTRSIPYMAHLKMMAAAQPFLSGGISKTVNMPATATVEDIKQAYIEAWKFGLKCVAIYRDGSKRSQPLNTKKETVDIAKTSTHERRRMPDTRPALTHKFDIAGHEGYLTVGYFDNGEPGEVFIQMAKEGSTIGGLMDTIGTLTSIALQYGVPLDTLVKKFSHQRFEPSGFTKNKDIKQASSIIDYVFRWIALHQTVTVSKDTVATKAATKIEARPAYITIDAPSCPSCGHLAVRNGACYKCMNCGESLGCS
jgi:ribonucleoside-diphosphate reductase alpha chain